MTKHSFLDFRILKKRLTIKAAAFVLGLTPDDFTGKEVFVYPEYNFIEILEDETYLLVIDRSEYKSKDLLELEEKLYDYYKNN